jgi:hypothetical protein
MAGVGVLLIFFGLFSMADRCAVPIAPCPRPRPTEIVAYAGLLILILAVGLLMRSARRGSLAGAASAAAASVPATWFLYEILRQGLCPLIDDDSTAQACFQAYGTMTAPVLSAAVAVLLFAIGWLWSQHASQA